MTATAKKGTCFVIMGFAEKTDYPTGRVLNLDASYQHMIKPAVIDAGLECIRADEIVHSGPIDVPMYEHLLDADVVIADLSTYNPNALYELGVRHALRPYTTIVISEKELKYPFDINHTVIRSYEHLGKDIGAGEALRFRGVLTSAIKEIVSRPEQASDSPVYTFIPDLSRPERAKRVAAAAAMGAVVSGSEQAITATVTPSNAANATTISALMAQFAQLKTQGNFAAARDILEVVRMWRPGDHYVIHQLALATYKAKQPTAAQALIAAKAILEPLSPHGTTDPETLGLWGAVHKRLWELNGDRRDLDEAIRAYEKGFYLKNDYYNGINLAFLLNARAAISPPADAVADFIDAQRIRRRVVKVCDEARAIRERAQSLSGDETDANTTTERLVFAREPDDEPYWIEATAAEAWFGIGETAKYEEALARAFSLAAADWMKDSTREQLAKLGKLLESSPLRFIKTDG